MTTVFVCGDLHCGHIAGLTPPGWRVNGGRYPGVHEMQARAWDAWLAMIAAVGPIDVAIVNGDLIDGPGQASGGTEELTTDCVEQAEMAAACLEPLRPTRGYAMTYGTAYHTGKGSDYEGITARLLERQGVPVDIRSHQWVDVDGVVFDCKHHIGGSAVPHGRHTAIAKDRLWNLIWAEQGRQPKGGVVIRSHVHYHAYCGGPGWLAMTLPALQQANTKYGARRCSGTVDWGAVVFTIDNGEIVSWRPMITQYLAAPSELLSL